MSKSVEDTRRELFEDWHNKKAIEQAERQEFQSVLSWLANKEILWLGFNAALDAVEIELPYLVEQKPYNHPNNAWNDALKKSKLCIEANNLGLKIK